MAHDEKNTKEDRVVIQAQLPAEYDEERDEWKFNARMAFVVQKPMVALVPTDYFEGQA